MPKQAGYTWLSCRVDKPFAWALKEMAKAQGRSMSMLIRQSITNQLKQDLYALMRQYMKRKERERRAAAKKKAAR